MALTAAGSRVGPYVIEERAGQGAMGTVYRARHAESGATVALKLLDLPGSDDDGARARLARFEVETQTLARLEHPHVVGVHAAGVLPGGCVPWVALEWMPNGSLRDRLLAGALPAREAVAVASKLAGALAFLHANMVVHRDVKPENVLFDEAGEPRLADFGMVRDDAGGLLADATKTGAIVGTPAYLAPEGFGGDRGACGPWTDVWALGVLLYEMLTGRRPFDAESLPQLYHAVRKTTPVAPRRIDSDIPRDVERICLRALEREPADRYRAAGLLAQDLDCVLEGRPPSRLARRSSAFVSVALRVRGSLSVRASIAGAVLVLSGVMLAWAFAGGTAASEARQVDADEAAALVAARARARRLERDRAWERAERAAARAIAAPDPSSVRAAREAIDAFVAEGDGADAEAGTLVMAFEEGAYRRLEAITDELLFRMREGRNLVADAASYADLDAALGIVDALGLARTRPATRVDVSLFQLAAFYADADLPDGARAESARRDAYVDRLIAAALAIYEVAGPSLEEATERERNVGAIMLARDAERLVNVHLVRHGEIAHACDALEGARARAERAFRTDEGEPVATLRAAEVAAASGEVERARERLGALHRMLDEAVAAKDERLRDARRVANVLRDAARLRIAIYERAGRRDASLVDEASADCWLAAGLFAEKRDHMLDPMTDLHVRQGRPERAVALLERAIERWPRDWRLRFALARHLLDAGRPEDAVARLEQARATPGITARDRAGLDEWLGIARDLARRKRREP